MSLDFLDEVPRIKNSNNPLLLQLEKELIEYFS